MPQGYLAVDLLVRLHNGTLTVPQAASFFGHDAARFIGMIDQLVLSSRKTRYTFTATEEFERIVRDDPRRGMQIYWGEILARSHLTAVTTVLRSRHWIDAVISGAGSNNSLAFAAALRGLIESAADASTALERVPCTLARDHSQIVRALSGDLGKPFFVVSQIEDDLIHFSYARHLTKDEGTTAPRSHKARKVREYIEVLERGKVTEVVKCYQALCDLTHPGASSVWMWLNPINELELDLATDKDESVIAYFLAEYRMTFLELLMFAFNPAIVTLNVLNYFPVVQFHVPQLLNWDLSRIPMWEKCRNDLIGVRPQARAGLTMVKPNPPSRPKRQG